MSQLSSPDTQEGLNADTLAATTSSSEILSFQPPSQPCQKFSPGSFRSQVGRSQLILSPWNPRLPTLFQNEENFRPTTSIGVLEATSFYTSWDPHTSYAKIRDSLRPGSPSSAPARSQPHTLSALIVYIDQHPAADYGCQLSISRCDLEELVGQIQMHDSAIGDLLGESRYCSAFGRSKDIEDQQEAGYEFFCQHPCWLAESCHDRTSFHLPWSVYMHHDRTRNSTFYVIAAARHDDMINETIGRLGVCDAGTAQSSDALQATAHPFLLHVLISGTAFQRSSAYVAAVRKELTAEIAAVNDYSNQEDDFRVDTASKSHPKDHQGRGKLKTITKNLHKISQTCDIGIANADMSIRLCEDMLSAYECFGVTEPARPSDSWRQVLDSMRWISKTWYRQKEWLISYKARKDTAMNLVYNLVAQQDNAVNIDIAQQAAQHSSSMNSITILTMIFLPGTFLAGLFGSGILDQQVSHGLSDIFYPFLWMLLPITLLTISTWYWRKILGRLCLKVGRMITSWRLRQRSASEDVERGDLSKVGEENV